MKALLLGGLIALCIPAYAENSSPMAQLITDQFGCGNSPHGKQRVYAYSGNAQLDDWTVDPNAIHKEKLTNGYTVGLQIKPASDSEYKREAEATKTQYVPEMVRISLYDVSSKTPRLLTYTFGGANSIQGYTARGGADSVTQLGEPGLTLILEKPACVPVIIASVN